MTTKSICEIQENPEEELYVSFKNHKSRILGRIVDDRIVDNKHFHKIFYQYYVDID